MTDPTTGWTMRETLPAIPRSVPLVRRAVARLAADAGATGDALEGVRLAVSEAMSNVVVHAYRDRDEPGPVHVGATVTGDRLLVRICDEGCGMGPRLDSPGLGLGLPLIARSVDALDVHHGDAGGTEIRMAFSLSAFSTKSGR